MRITRPEPEPRDNGDYRTYVNGIAYGEPYAMIYLDEAADLRLDGITLDDARRLAKAAVQAEQELSAAHARMTAPHGSDHFHKGTCQLCGKPEADELHAVRAEWADEPAGGPEVAGRLYDAIVNGTPVVVYADEPEPGTQAYADKYSSRAVQRELLGEAPATAAGAA